MNYVCKSCDKQLWKGGKPIEPFFILVLPGDKAWNPDKAGNYCLSCFDEQELRTNL